MWDSAHTTLHRFVEYPAPAKSTLQKLLKAFARRIFEKTSFADFFTAIYPALQKNVKRLSLKHSTSRNFLKPLAAMYPASRRVFMDFAGRMRLTKQGYGQQIKRVEVRANSHDSRKTFPKLPYFEKRL